jgi:hypothetical protein
MSQLHPLSPSHPNPSVAQFAPRREFLKEQHTFSTFALLALSGTGLVRLCSFPPSLVQALHGFFDHRNLIAGYREAPNQNLTEIHLHGRPWATAKNIKSEKLIVEILTIIFQHGYIFLSTIDYGREQDDRLAIAFSKPAQPPNSRSGSPMPGVTTVAGSVPPSAPRTIRVPIGISFSSPTLLRVINPPLNSTPAILQAVRGAWPRGVVSEKKVDTSFEFRLKGYRCKLIGHDSRRSLRRFIGFQEDTFATDSLQHILALLSSLDAHGFKLLTSLSLTNRSRIKDLWIFTGPGEPVFPDSPPSTPNGSRIDLRRTPGQGNAHYRGSMDAGGSSGGSSHDGRSPGSSGGGHSRLAVSPTITPFPPPYQNSAAQSSGHIRSSSEPTPNARGGSFAMARALLRKPGRTSQTQVPLATNPEDSPQRPMAALAPALPPTSEEEPLRTTLPSEVGSVINMTGVGAGHTRDWDGIEEEDELIGVQNPHPQASIIYATHGRQDGQMPGVSTPDERVSAARSSAGPEGSIAMYYQNSGALTPSILYSHSPLDAHPRTPSPQRSDGIHTPTPPLLGMGAFRDMGSTSPPELASSTPSPPLLGAGAFRDTIRSSSPPRESTAQTLNMSRFNSGAFRDSALTMSDYKTQEVPGAWAGASLEPGRAQSGVGIRQREQSPRRPAMPSAYASAGPMLPGAWQPTPASEKAPLVTQNSTSVDPTMHTTLMPVGHRSPPPRIPPLTF